METKGKIGLTGAEAEHMMVRLLLALQRKPVPSFIEGGIVHGQKTDSEMVVPKQFTTSPELEKMVRISNKMNEDYKAEMRKRYGSGQSPQNCKVGKKHNTYGGMPALQVRAIFKKEHMLIQKPWLTSENYNKAMNALVEIEKRFGPVGSDGRKVEQCPGPVLCDPAGRRSRIEWCGKCGKIE